MVGADDMVGALDKVDDGLYICGAVALQDVARLRRHGIKYILNAAEEDETYVHEDNKLYRELNEHFRANSFLGGGHTATLMDYAQCEHIQAAALDRDKFPHLLRWHACVSHLRALHPTHDRLGRPIPAGVAANLAGGQYAAMPLLRLKEFFEVKTLGAKDEDHYDLSARFNEIANFIAEGKEAGGVAVHCVHGISRSATSVIAYLMLKEQLSLYAAFLKVHCARDKILPNPGFWEQLQVRYKQLLKEGVELQNSLDTSDQPGEGASSTHERGIKRIQTLDEDVARLDKDFL